MSLHQPILLPTFVIAYAMLVLSMATGAGANGPLTEGAETSPRKATALAASLPECPSELFGAQAKGIRPQWRQFYREVIQHQPANRYHAAMGLGAVYADIILAAEARDGQQIRNLLQDLEALEKMLGLAEASRPARQRTAAFARESDWPGIRRHMKDTIKLHQRTLVRQRDEDLANLAYIGEWMRTLQICTQLAIKQKTQSPEGLVSWTFLTDELRRRADLLAVKVDSKTTRRLKRQMFAIERTWRNEITVANLPARLQKMLPIINESMSALVNETASSAP